MYLGGAVNIKGGTNEDIRRRLGHARTAWNKLRVIWNNSQIVRMTKIRLFNSNVVFGHALWLWNMEDDKWRWKDARSLPTQVLEENFKDLLAPKRAEWDSKGKSWNGGTQYHHQKENVAMDMTRSAYGKEQACQNCINGDTGGNTQERNT